MYVKCKGNFMEVKYFVICTDLQIAAATQGKFFSYFEIEIFMLLKLESESAMQNYAIESGIRRFFAIPALNSKCPKAIQLFSNYTQSPTNHIKM